jgi:hypothetical protein
MMSATMTIPRMYTDDAGDSRFDAYEVQLDLHAHANPPLSKGSMRPPSDNV